MELIKINSNNRPYYSDDFIKGFECGAKRQFEADKKARPKGERIAIGTVCEVICKHCIKANGCCQHHWKCPLLTEIAELIEPKDEPQTNADQHVQRVEYVGNDEKSRCWTCKHFERMHETPISSDGSYYTYVVCTASECRYEPKDEPQTEREGE